MPSRDPTLTSPSINLPGGFGNNKSLDAASWTRASNGGKTYPLGLVEGIGFNSTGFFLTVFSSIASCCFSISAIRVLAFSRSTIRFWISAFSSSTYLLFSSLLLTEIAAVVIAPQASGVGIASTNSFHCLADQFPGILGSTCLNASMRLPSRRLATLSSASRKPRTVSSLAARILRSASSKSDKDRCP